MKDTGYAEIHFINNDHEVEVEIIPSFKTLIRMRDEAVILFKERVTNHVLKQSRLCNLDRVVNVKWSIQLGYHQGFIDCPVSRKLTSSASKTN